MRMKKYQRELNLAVENSYFTKILNTLEDLRMHACKYAKNPR